MKKIPIDNAGYLYILYKLFNYGYAEVYGKIVEVDLSLFTDGLIHNRMIHFIHCIKVDIQ